MTVFLLDPPPDFRYQPTVRSHGWGSLLPFRLHEAGDRAADVLERTQRLSDGTILDFDVRPDGDRLRVTTTAALSPEQAREVSAITARCLSFDHDLTPFYDLLRDQPDYAWIAAARAGRMLVSPTVWEDLAKTLLTTNTTWAMTKGMVARLVALDPDGAFPPPEAVAALDPEALNAQVRAGYRGSYLHELAIRIASGELEPEAWRDPALSSAEVYKALKRIKGFGDYAAGAMMRLLMRFDELGLDSVCRSMFARRFNGGSPVPDREIAAYYAPFGAWQGLAVWMDVMRAYISGDA